MQISSKLSKQLKLGGHYWGTSGVPKHRKPPGITGDLDPTLDILTGLQQERDLGCSGNAGVEQSLETMKTAYCKIFIVHLIKINNQGRTEFQGELLLRVLLRESLVRCNGLPPLSQSPPGPLWALHGLQGCRDSDPSIRRAAKGPGTPSSTPGY